MEIINSNSFNGWFVGNFEPCLIKSTDFEFGYKIIEGGTKPDYHFHRFKTEYTVLLEGKIELQFSKEIIKPITTIMLKPNEKNDQFFIEKSLILVINTPSKPGDKYF